MCERYLKNIEILKHLKNGTASADMLSKYSGWGGLREAIYTPEIYKQLKKVATPEEIDSIKKTLKSAYFTPDEIIKFICQALARMGYNGGRVLEPAAGVGSFIKHLSILKPKEIVAVEIDDISSKILAGLYPEVDVKHAAFQDVEPGKFDLIIGNPPYGADKVEDKKHSDLTHLCIHHYFVAKCMRMLKPAGILAMVLPSYFMDNRRDHARDIIAKEGGELIAAFRLSDDLFANAKVTVDIVFLGKKQTGITWQRTLYIFVAGHRMPINEYYIKHRDNILGWLDAVDMYDRKGLTCRRKDATILHYQPNCRLCRQDSCGLMHIIMCKSWIHALQILPLKSACCKKNCKDS